MRRRLELRDLRSLERRSMYSIFHPLDPNERLPRELILEGKRHSLMTHRSVFALAGAFYLPGLMLTVVVLTSFGVSAVVAFVISGLLLVGVFVYSLIARFR